MPTKPSEALYSTLQQAYEHFNGELFEGKLPTVMFTVQRQNGMLGYFSPERWSDPKGRYCHEISINPSHIGTSRVIDVLQTLVHEMVHCWQFCFGTPGRGSYHNQEWANKMKSVGLQPSDTGFFGGKETGQSMSDYPIQDGRFVQSCCVLIHEKQFLLPWIDRLVIPSESRILTSEERAAALAHLDAFENPQLSISGSLSFDDNSNLMNEGLGSFADKNIATLNYSFEQLMPTETFYQPKERLVSKIKYTCQTCRINVWGKPGLNLICGDCDEPFSGK